MTGLSYSLREELKRLRKVPRVIKGKDIKLKKGPQFFMADIITPKEKITQVLYAHYIVIGPGGKSDKHGQKNVKFPEKNETPYEALSRAEKKWNF